MRRGFIFSPHFKRSKFQKGVNKMIIDRTKPSVTKIGGMFIYPGKNVIKKEDEAKVKKDPAFQANIDAGMIKIVDIHDQDGKADDAGSATEGKAAEIAELSTKEAIEIIKGVLSIPELEEIAAGEDRKAVLKAIKKQIEEIKADQDDGAGDE